MDTVADDFREMKTLGANIVRIHLSVSQFLDAPDKSNAKNVARQAAGDRGDFSDGMHAGGAGRVYRSVGAATDGWLGFYWDKRRKISRHRPGRWRSSPPVGWRCLERLKIPS